MKLVGLTLTAGALLMLSSCSLVQQQTQKTEGDVAEAVKKPTKKASSRSNAETVRPTPEQMKVAVQALQKDEADSPASPAGATVSPPAGATISPPAGAPTGAASSTPAVNAEAPASEIITEPVSANEPEVIPGGLRMGRFAPPEEAVSSSDDDMPAPNSVELHGFRSPNLKGGTLPMNINGKINKSE